MPLKEYICQSCQHRFEVVLWLREPDPAACPKCGGGPLKQLLGTFRIVGVRSKSASSEERGGDFGAGLDEAGPNGDGGGEDALGDDFGGGEAEGAGDTEDLGDESEGGSGDDVGKSDDIDRRKDDI